MDIIFGSIKSQTMQFFRMFVFETYLIVIANAAMIGN
jgi:hypothetical protein